MSRNNKSNKRYDRVKGEPKRNERKRQLRIAQYGHRVKNFKKLVEEEGYDLLPR